MAVGSFGAQAARAVESQRERAERDVASICREERDLAARVRLAASDIAGVDVVAAPTVAFSNQFMRCLEFRRRFGGRDVDVGESHRGQRACRAPGDGLRVRMRGDSAARYSTVATTTDANTLGSFGRPQEIPPATCGHQGEMKSEESFALAARSFTWRRKGPATPVHGRPTLGMAMAKRMGGGPAMHTVSEAQELLVDCFDCDATAAAQRDRPGQIRRDQKRNVRDYRVPVSSRLIRIGSTISDLDEQARRHCQALPNIIQLISRWCERVAFDRGFHRKAHMRMIAA